MRSKKQQDGGEKHLRLFVAVDFPKSVKINLCGLIEKLKGDEPDIRWEKLEKIHLTLAFLGYVSEKKVVDIEKAIEKSILNILPFSLFFTKLGFFLRGGRLVIWLGITDSQKLIAFRTRLYKELTRSNFKMEKRPFSPHVTLGRKKNESNGKKWRSITENLDKKRYHLEPFSVNEIVLIQSKLSPKGSIYEVVRRFPFFKTIDNRNESSCTRHTKAKLFIS